MNVARRWYLSGEFAVQGAAKLILLGYFAILAACGGPGTVVSQPAVPTAPTIAVEPQNQSVVLGMAATFTVTANGTAPLAYQWSKDGAAIGGATAASYTTPATFSADSGATFTVLVANSAGTVTSAAAVLTVTATVAAPSITTQPANQSVSAGATATFSVTATGTAPLSYQWSKNGTAINGATAASYTTPATVIGDSGATFTVKVTNSVGNVTSTAATLTVMTAAVAPSITSQPVNQSVSAGATATFSVTATGTAPLSYQWSKNGTAINGAMAASYTTPATVIGDSGATFTVKVTNSVNNVSSTAATLTVVPASGSVTITPQLAPLTTSQTQQFTAVVPGAAAANWSVDSVGGGNSTVGTISAGGVFTPGTLVGIHTIQATSSANSSQSATATVAVTDLAGVYTYHNDAARTGQNLQEYALTPAVVSGGKFGKLWSCAVDGAVYAQPLYVANLAIGGGTHNVVFVATEHDSVYAFDADSKPANASSCVTYWTFHLVTGTSVPSIDTNCDDTPVEVGITGTPVIDPSTKTLYFVAKSKESGAYFQKLHAVSLTTGAERSGSPATIAASDSKNTFDALRNYQKPGLALANGNVYVGFSSHCDVGPYSGWFMSYDANSLVRTAAFDVTPNSAGGEGGIWMSGGAPAVDSSGSVYLSTGNGNFAYNATNSPTPVPSNIDLGMSFIKFGPSNNLLVQDFYSPTNEASWSAMDLDISSSGVTVLPDGAGPSGHPNLLIGSDKQANLWLLDRSNMGGFIRFGNNPAVQQILLDPASCGAKCVFSTPVYYNQTIYIGNSGGFIVALPLVSGAFGVNPNNGFAVASSPSNDYYGFPGPTPVIGAAPSGAAVLWALDTANNGTGGAGVGPALLRAYDAGNLGTRLYSSNTLAADTGPDAIKFAVPVVANGHVYVGGSNLLVVYGPL